MEMIRATIKHNYDFEVISQVTNDACSKHAIYSSLVCCLDISDFPQPFFTAEYSSY